MESNKTRLLPEGVCAVYLSGNSFLKFDPSACDPKLLKKHLVFFADERLEGLAELKKDVRSGAKLFSTTHKGYQERFSKFEMIRKLEEAKEENRLEELFEVKKPRSSTADVPGALTTREAVQAEIDALRSRFNVEQEVPARFIERFSDIPGEESTDAAFAFTDLPFLPAPYSMEIVFADEYLTYAKPYRDYLLLHEFAHCLQVLDNWPYRGNEAAHHDESFRDACAKLGIDPEQEGGYYPTGSNRLTCQSCGDVKYAKEDEALRLQNTAMTECAKTFKCPHCFGKIAVERIDKAVFIIGDEVSEVSPDGTCTTIGTTRKPPVQKRTLGPEDWQRLVSQSDYKSNPFPCDADSALYEDIRSAFSPVSVSSKDEFWELMSSIFAGGDHWSNRSDCYYFEFGHSDPAKPFSRILEQRPCISRAVFPMTEDDYGDENLLRYAEQTLTRASGNLLRVNYAMTWFFLNRFRLLPSCCSTWSKGKRLNRFLAPSRGHYEEYMIRKDLWNRGYRGDFKYSPVIFCGPLRPSEMLQQARGYRSVIIFPFNCAEWDDGEGAFSVTAYLIEFPEQIEGVQTYSEI